MKQVVSVLSLLLCSVAAFGQQSTASSDPATQEQVNRIFQLLNIDSQMAAMSGAMKQQSLAMVMLKLKKQRPDAPPAMVAEIGAAYDEMFTGLFKTISGSLISEVMAPVYEKHLTRAEADAVIAFYASPEGQSFIKKAPAITVEAMQSFMPRMQEQMGGLTDKFKVRMDAIMAKYKQGESKQEVVSDQQ
jgi:hypothetical protein